MSVSIHISKIDLQGGIFSLKKPSELIKLHEFHETSCPDRSHDLSTVSSGRELMDRGQRTGTSSKLLTINVAFNGLIMTSLKMTSSKSLRRISFERDRDFCLIGRRKV